jgi:hypothetical protein
MIKPCWHNWKSALICFKIPGTKRVDHRLAVKMYERAAGDKTLPSDLRPPVVLKVRLLDLEVLWHELIQYREPSTISSTTFFLEADFLKHSTSSAIALGLSETILQCNTTLDPWPSNATTGVHVFIFSHCT